VSGNPVQGEWMRDEWPRCQDCVHMVQPYMSGTHYDPTMQCQIFLHTAVTTDILRRDDLTLNFDICGSAGKFFERRTPDIYDFQNNPPPIGGWARE
jgi:hypothetical protein